MISIIIRTKNEERWIGHCLKKINQQIIDDEIELILVDNNSNDNTVDKAKTINPELKLVKIENFKPGLAINKGIRASSGEYIVVLSGHCLPVNRDWLKKLNNEKLSCVEMGNRFTCYFISNHIFYTNLFISR